METPYSNIVKKAGLNNSLGGQALAMDFAQYFSSEEDRKRQRKQAYYALGTALMFEKSKARKQGGDLAEGLVKVIEKVEKRIKMRHLLETLGAIAA